MTYSLSPYTLPRFIDTAPLHQGLAALCALTHLILGDSKEVLKNARRIARAARALIRAEQANARTELKLAMLLSPNWRARVLKDLGGTRALSRWERRTGVTRPRKRRCTLTPAQKEVRVMNLKKARAAKREKVAPKLKSFWSDDHPQIFRDPVQVDQEGQFRLAPIKRRPCIKTSQAPMRKVTGVTTRIKYNKINPIPLWPAEFRAAQEMEESPTPHAELAIRSQTPCNLPSKLRGVWDNPIDEPETNSHKDPEGLIRPRPT